MLFKAEFVTKAGYKFVTETEKLNVPASDGRRTILSNHMAIMLPLKPGTVETDNNGLHHYVVDDGVLYFEDNNAKIITDNFVDVSGIDINEVNKKLDEAEQMFNESDDNLVKLKAEKQLKWYKELKEAYNRYK